MINKKITRLQGLANKAFLAQYKFEQALEDAKMDSSWDALCEAEGIDPEATAGDWMC